MNQREDTLNEIGKSGWKKIKVQWAFLYKPRFIIEFWIYGLYDDNFYLFEYYNLKKKFYK